MLGVECAEIAGFASMVNRRVRGVCQVEIMDQMCVPHLVYYMTRAALYIYIYMYIRPWIEVYIACLQVSQTMLDAKVAIVSKSRNQCSAVCL